MFTGYSCLLPSRTSGSVAAVVSRRRALRTFLEIYVSAIPYLIWLLLYSVNDYTHMLPTAKSGEPPSVALNNVTAWETVVMPFSTNDLISSLNCPPLDLLAALPYLGHYVLPVLYPVTLVVFGHANCVCHFYCLVGWTTWLHYAISYVLPTAPPWFYDGQPVSNVSLSAVSPLVLVVPEHREGAVFARVDRMIGKPFFYSLYARNPVPFAAFPSGHVAWPMCVLLTVPAGTRRWPFLGHVVLISWATMYTRHHYLFDAVAAIVIVLGVENLLKRWSTNRHFSAVKLTKVQSAGRQVPNAGLFDVRTCNTVHKPA